MKKLIHIATQSDTIPTKLGATDNPGVDTLIANGFRWCDDATIPALAEGYERSAVRWDDSGDGVNGVAVYQDRLTAEIQAENYVMDLTLNGPRYVLENQYIILCDALRQSLGQQPAQTKLGFEELPAMMMALKAANVAAYETLRDAMDMVNAALIRYDVRWWDGAVYHTQPELQAASLKILELAQ